jgi:GNAT superfamily N-acetyltransferase
VSDIYKIRDAENDDVGFILSSWLKSAGEAWATVRRSDASTWPQGTEVGWFADVPHRFTRTAVAEILERPTTRALVACDPDEPHVIFGYAVGEPASNVLHWVHVKHSFRREGVGRDLVTRLLPDWRSGVTCTYVGRGFLGWMAKYPLRFNPHAGR